MDVSIPSFKEGCDPEKDVRTDTAHQSLSWSTWCLQWLKWYINEFSFSVTFYQESIYHSNYISSTSCSEKWSSRAPGCCVCRAIFDFCMTTLQQWNSESLLRWVPLSFREFRHEGTSAKGDFYNHTDTGACKWTHLRQLARLHPSCAFEGGRKYSEKRTIVRTEKELTFMLKTGRWGKEVSSKRPWLIDSHRWWGEWC